ncbi:MAG: helix-turn-helix transcriptional regulator [Clostridia bacterium]|nr:helix-turn-helix transcriptional regulator [Clostridia bacterium]
MLNPSDILRGYMDTIILSQLDDEDGYGYSISRQIAEKTDGLVELKEGTLYNSFRRLESLGLIESYWGNEQEGARRRYYHLTDTGRHLLQENIRDIKKYNMMIDRIFSKEEAV